MRKLIFAIVITFVPSISFAEGGWSADPRTGCKVWMTPSAKPNESVQWSGACVNGIAHGRGTVKWFARGKLWGRSEGELRNGKLNGRGAMIWVNGSRYDGELRDNLPNGRGTFTWADGTRYVGNWANSKPHGFGTYTESGRTLSGQWSNGCFRQGTSWAFLFTTKKKCGFTN